MMDYCSTNPELRDVVTMIEKQCRASVVPMFFRWDLKKWINTCVGDSKIYSAVIMGVQTGDLRAISVSFSRGEAGTKTIDFDVNVVNGKKKRKGIFTSYNREVER